jgi:hypothetical protein
MNIRQTRIRLTATAIVLSCLAGAQAADLTHLRCEYLADPLGIDVVRPRLSWVMENPKSKILNPKSEIPSGQEAADRGRKQTAYQVLVASTPELLAKDQGDLWDSGKVVSDQSIQVEYSGKPLESRTACHWKVRAWLDGYTATAWSEPSYWTMGLLAPNAWHGKWIGRDEDAPSGGAAVDARTLPARYLRREFSVARKVVRATTTVCGLGFFELYLNGRKVSDHVMDPALSDYRKAVYYVTFDVTSHLQQGSNAMGVILGNGRFFAPRLKSPAITVDYGYPKLLLQTDISYDDGSSAQIVSDENWKLTTQGPIRANNEYDGESGDCGKTPQTLVSTAYHYHNCRIMARAAKRLNLAEDAKQFESMADELKAAFNKRFFDPATARYQGATQCAYVLPLAFGLVPPEHHDVVVKNLVDDIMIAHQGHLSVGLIGMQWLMQVLTNIGRPDVAWTIATQTTRPSWGYMIGKGATTIWERWDCDTRDPGMNSEALLIQMGGLDAWFYQTLAGINYEPGQPAFKHSIIKPRPLGDLTWVKAYHDSPYGRITSNWQLTDDRLSMEVTIPPNTIATIHVPAKDATTVTESGIPAAQAAGVKFLRMENGAALYAVGSGTYQFSSGSPK